ncbi:MAG TPA: hypothetical protein HA292_03110 [Candidatus Nitrosotenuis sp.]|jgi:predicted secreted protein with PEFG-CTERM motif|nr:hypothetical protein [Candidatus Nitrosotenuis sp.]HIH68196.1 hypothetical protein [Candidatus Nitrosotenuis sp.]HII04208.1 hypothetical protein [Candidatus Nitrosotenuis sp.]
MKIILGLLVLSFLISPIAFAQQDTKFGQNAIQQVSIEISDNGDAHVTHQVKGDIENTQHIPYITSNFSNLGVTDSKGSPIQYAEAGGKTPGIVIFPTKTDTLIKYDIPSAVKLKDGLWTWDYYYLADSAFYLPENVKLFYANNNLVQLKEEKGFDCHGCQIKLEYELKPTFVTQKIKWEDKSFDIQTLTLIDMQKIKLDQGNKSLSFDVTQPNKHITLIIPKELLGNPYDVYLNGNLIKKQEHIDVKDNVWLHIIPNQKGTIRIQGVTVVPEFPLASVLVLSASMITVLYLTRLSHR